MLSPKARHLFAFALVLSACSDPTPQPTPTQIAPTPAVTLLAPPTIEPTQTPSPTPTPDPIALLANAERDHFFGEYSRAADLYRQALPLLASDASSQTRYKLGRALYESNNFDGAIDALKPVTDSVLSLILIARAYEAKGDSLNAASHYSFAIGANTVLTPYLNLWLGNYYVAKNLHENAIALYQAAIANAPSVSTEFERREKLAAAFMAANLPNEAQKQYDEILSRARFPSYRASILFQSSLTLLASGNANVAYTRMREVMTNHEQSQPALLALRALLDANQPVDEYLRGKINFYNDQHVAARDAFRRAILSNDGRADEVRLFAARNYIKLGLPDDAIRNLNLIVSSNPPSSQKAIEGLSEKVKLYAAIGNFQNAKDTLSQLRKVAPSSKAGAAILYSTGEALTRAPEMRDEALNAFYAADALQFDPRIGASAFARIAPMRFRAGEYTRAISDTSYALNRFDKLGDAEIANNILALRFWLGKSQIAAGQVVSGQTTLRALTESSPESYEGVRAAQLISQTQIPKNALGESQDDAEAWLRSWNNLSATVQVRELREDIRGDIRFRRGDALWTLGFEPEALDEFSALLESNARDPLALYALAQHFRDIGIYKLSIRAADALMRLSPSKTPLALPVFISKHLYPTYYAELVEQAAKDFNLDPKLIYSVIRQESLFEPFAESSAAASGLMQVIPTTGQEINRELVFSPNFVTSDLNKPYVSVKFGSYYLAKQRRLFDGDMFATLAAYNGGPGNALRWKEQGQGDHDLFLETVSFNETKRYIRLIVINQAVYNAIYIK
jgi:soluble lytic murein transglycosylase